jgi:UDP-N-acetyl-D-mannosaminuronate dehydrogenase
LGKLLDTSYYGICIAWHGEMKKFCDKANVDFNEVVVDFNETYNDGYKKLGKLNVIRPVLYPPQNGIGGHCLISNAKILSKYLKSKSLDLILRYKPKKG